MSPVYKYIIIMYLSMAPASVVLRSTAGMKMCDFPETIPMVQTDESIKCACDNTRFYCGPREDLCMKYECKGNQTLLQDCFCTCPEHYKTNVHGECIRVNTVRCKDEEVELPNGRCGQQIITDSSRNTTEMDILTSNISHTGMITTNAMTTIEGDLSIHTRPEGEQTITTVPDLFPANNTHNYTVILIPVLVVCVLLIVLGIISCKYREKIKLVYRNLRKGTRRTQHVYHFRIHENGTKEISDENNHLLGISTNVKEQGKDGHIRIPIRDETSAADKDQRDQTATSDNDHKPSDEESGANKDEAAHEDDKITNVSETGSNTNDSNDHDGYEGDCTDPKKVNDGRLTPIDTGQLTQPKTHLNCGSWDIDCGPPRSSVSSDSTVYRSPLDNAENGPQLSQYHAHPTTRDGTDRHVFSGNRSSIVFQPDITEQTDYRLQ